MDADLQAVHDLLDTTTLSEEKRHTVSWCLGQLPDLYESLKQTSDTRYIDEICRLVRGLLEALRAASNPGARRSADAVALRLVAMHERLGLPNLDIKLARVRKAC